MRLVDKAALVAEIESKFQKYWKMGEESDALQDGNAKYWGGVLSCLNEVKTLIDTLEVKEVDLTPTVYVVTRCEEHSDYAEKVFLDENKAIEYCKQFEGNENEYGRDITEIEVSV